MTPDECADAILALINSRPRSPTRDEIMALVSTVQSGLKPIAMKEWTPRPGYTEIEPSDWNDAFHAYSSIVRRSFKLGKQAHDALSKLSNRD